MLSSQEGAFVDLPPMSCGEIYGAAAIAVDESDSAAGQVLLLGGAVQGGAVSRTVRLVGLATGVCTPGRPDLLRPRFDFAAAGLPGGGIVCAGGSGDFLAEMWGAPVQGAPDAAWTWRPLPTMSVGRYGCCGCVLSDGRFAVLGGYTNYGATSSCEALAIGDDNDEHCVTLPPMHDARAYFACAAVAGCVIVAGGWGLNSAEVYDEVLGRWLRLPCGRPYVDGLESIGSALL
jgi:hypothetical protein